MSANSSHSRAHRFSVCLFATLVAGVLVAPAAQAAVPDAPGQPTVTAGDSQITVEFTPPFDGGVGIDHYTASCSSSNGGVSSGNTGANSPIVVTGLTNGKTYTCSVTATNADGDSAASPDSVTVIPSTTPDAPAQPSVARGNGQITVSFTAPFNGGSAITGYTATCASLNGGAPGNATDTGSPVDVTGLTNGKTYTCSVTATNANGDGPSSPPSGAAIPSRVPDAPAQPTVNPDDSQITVTFTPP
ncbi:MAG TPA: fibronectin type III domain-containing protein, partial [Acidimicrobiia bacterium]|nr:fibronectin type III domain-containing protein [Acidimicrobiia bacterium]